VVHLAGADVEDRDVEQRVGEEDLVGASAFQKTTAPGGASSIQSRSRATPSATPSRSGGGSASTGTPAASSARRPGVGKAGCSSSTAARTGIPSAASAESRRRALDCAPPVEKLLVTTTIPSPGRLRRAAWIARG
jgi:hypothetical protein